MATSKVLQPLPCFVRSIYNGSLIKNIRFNTLSAASNRLYNLENAFVQNRYFSTEKNVQGNIKKEDDVIRVYNGILTSQIRRVKMFSLSTSFIGICAQPLIYTELSNVQSMPLILFACSVVGFFTFVNPFLLHYVSKKYVTHLDYNKEKNNYAATIMNFWCINKKHEFNVDDVVVPDVPGMFTTFIAKGKPMFIDAKFFDNPSHYAKIMGYDKPMDFKLYETSGNKKS